MKRTITILLMVNLLGLLLSACMGNASANNASITLDVTLIDSQFEPLAWTVSPGQTIILNLTNSGTMGHTWTLMQTPISGPYTADDQADILFDSGVVPADTSKQVSFTAPRMPGDYQVICIQPGHIEAGMVGLLTVK